MSAADTARERIAQGLPAHVADPAVLDRVAGLLLERASGQRVETPPPSGAPTTNFALADHPADNGATSVDTT